jgi:hypothetical protein
MMSIINELEVTELEVLDILDFRVKGQLWEGVRISLQLFLQWFNVILVYMSITKHVNEFTSLQAANLSQHAG